MNEIRQIRNQLLVQKVSDIAVALFYIAVRATLVWGGLLLIDLSRLGLPPATWLQALGLVMVVRPLFGALNALPRQTSVPDQASIARLANQMQNAFLGSEFGQAGDDQGRGRN